MENLLPPLGWILDVLAFAAISYFFNMSHINEVDDQEIQQYIDHSKPVQLTVSKIVSSDFHFIAGRARMLGKTSFPVSSALIYDSTKKKYLIQYHIGSKIP